MTVRKNTKGNQDTADWLYKNLVRILEKSNDNNDIFDQEGAQFISKLSKEAANDFLALSMVGQVFPSLLDTYFKHPAVTMDTKTEALKTYVENKRGGLTYNLYTVMDKFFKAGAQNPYTANTIGGTRIVNMAAAGYPVPLPNDPQSAMKYVSDLGSLLQQRTLSHQKAAEGR